MTCDAKRIARKLPPPPILFDAAPDWGVGDAAARVSRADMANTEEKDQSDGFGNNSTRRDNHDPTPAILPVNNISQKIRKVAGNHHLAHNEGDGNRGPRGINPRQPPRSAARRRLPIPLPARRRA